MGWTNTFTTGWPSVVSGLPMVAMSCTGNNLEKPHLAWMINFGKTISCTTGLSKWLALSKTEQSIGRKGFLHLQWHCTTMAWKTQINVPSALMYIISISVHSSEYYLIISFVFSPKHMRSNDGAALTTQTPNTACPLWYVVVKWAFLLFKSCLPSNTA